MSTNQAEIPQPLESKYSQLKRTIEMFTVLCEKNPADMESARILAEARNMLVQLEKIQKP